MTVTGRTLVDRVVARTALDIVAKQFSLTSDAEHRCFRIKNLTVEEIIALLKIWTEEATARGAGSTRLVIAGDADPRLPAEFRAEPGRTITYYRNNNPSALVYVETKTESDEQGLRNLFTLRDSNFLDGSFDRVGFTIGEVLADNAWREAVGSGEKCPDILKRDLLEILKILQGITTVPVRRFAGFVVAACLSRSTLAKALDGGEIAALVGRCLGDLDIFPDEAWKREASRARIERRLSMNSAHADLTNGSGVDLDLEELARLCGSFTFKDEAGRPYPESEQSRWRRLCSTYLRTQSQADRRKIPYRIFEQLFARDTLGLRLGERVRQELSDVAHERVPEFDDLRVQDGLNIRSQEDAQRFLDAPADAGLQRLCDLVRPATRKLIERIANPAPKPFDNPITRIAATASAFRERMDRAEAAVTIQMRLIGTPATPATGLFSFLFGRTIKSIAATARDNPADMWLDVDPRLVDACNVPELADASVEAEDDEFDDAVVSWDGVKIDFRLLDRDSNALIDSEPPAEWKPESLPWLALFWLVMAADDAPQSTHTLRMPLDLAYRDWLDGAVSRRNRLDSIAHQLPEGATDSPLQEILDIRKNFRQATREKGGVAPDDISSFVDHWQELLQAASREYVPAGQVDSRMSSLLSMDSVDLGSRGLIILPSHPFKLRWIGKFLQKSEDLAVKALAGDLQLNQENPDFYLDWINLLTPNQQPPFCVGQNRELLFSAGSLGWAEAYSQINDEDARQSISEIDSTSADEIARHIGLYLEAHPYKQDGLSILIVLPHGNAFPSDLVKRFRRGAWREVPVKVHVLAVRNSWEAITVSFEGLGSPNRMNDGGQLFPPLELSLYEFRRGQSLSDNIGIRAFDIVVVPQFLNDRITVQQNTEPLVQREGRFEPLEDPAIHIPAIEGSGAIAIQMRPAMPDGAMEAWSTLAVRHHRSTPVSPQQPGNLDFVELRVDFEDASAFFSALHSVSNWVITLERHISREQIEQLEARPEVLVVLENVGKNGANKLIVSSNAGRRFIVDRLQRKLVGIAGAGGGESLRAIAERVYDETRNLAPRLTLQATGLSRTVEEILGLLVSRHVASRQYPVRPMEGLVAWVPLDEQPEWFNGGDRADYCRITLDLADNKLSIDILVVEGKLRQSYDPHGVAQVERTLNLIRGFLPAAGDGVDLADAPLWRQRLLDAVKNLSPEAREIHGSRFAGPSGLTDLLRLARARLRVGAFSVRSLRGLYSFCRYAVPGAMLIERDIKPSIDLIKTFAGDMFSLILPEAEAAAAEITTLQPDSAASAPVAERGPQPPALAKHEATESVIITVPDPKPPEAAPGYAVAVVPAASAPGGADQVDKLNHQPRRMSKAELEQRYQVILDKFSEFGIEVKAPPSAAERHTEGPASILFRITLGQGVDPKRVYDKAEVLKLALRLDEEQGIRFGSDRGYVTLDVPKDETERYFISAESLWSRWCRPESELVAPLGEDRTGCLVSIDFSSTNSPHLLIGGTTGSGKSEALNTILGGLTRFYSPKELELLLIDPKGTELQQYEGREGHLRGDIGMFEEDAVKILDEAVDEMQRRYLLFREDRVNSLQKYNQANPSGKLPWWVVVLDEYADLTSEVEAKREIEARLKRLAQKARAAGIHVIIATQKPSAEVISTTLRANLPAQLALRVRSATESRVIMDDPGAETLNGKGDAFLKVSGRLTRVQCAKQ
jgi:S-DNA-T family DNA segregation ATPase FtsK/SpoIIIE